MSDFEAGGSTVLKKGTLISVLTTGRHATTSNHSSETLLPVSVFDLTFSASVAKVADFLSQRKYTMTHWSFWLLGSLNAEILLKFSSGQLSKYLVYDSQT